MYSGGLNHGGPFTSGIQGVRDNISDLDHDDLYESWLENGKETADIMYTEEPMFVMWRVHLVQKFQRKRGWSQLLLM